MVANQKMLKEEEFVKVLQEINDDYPDLQWEVNSFSNYHS